VLRDAEAPPPKPYVPVWQPPEYPPEPKKPKVTFFPSHVDETIRACCPHRPSIKKMVDAMRLDGYSEEQIKKCRNSYAEFNRNAEKRDQQFQKLFGGKDQKVVKRVLKVVKKR
jgi:hypothetical protein